MKITPQHHQAAQLLAMGHTAKKVADDLKVDPVTVSRWKADYNFQALINSLILDAQQETGERLRSLAASALTTIENIMQDNEAPPKDRLTAALKVLEMVKVEPSQIKSTNPAVLEHEAKQRDLLDEYRL